MRIRVEKCLIKTVRCDEMVVQWRNREGNILEVEAELRLPLKSLLKNAKQNRSSQCSSHEYPFMIIITCFILLKFKLLLNKKN